MNLTLILIAVPFILLVVGGGMYWAAVRSGRIRERLDNAEATIDAGKTRNTAEDQVRRLGPDAVHDELRRDWKRR
jgi:hypothetical protein